MQTLIILLTQTKSEAIVEMLILLFSSAIIGCITLLLYYKSFYIKLIKANELEIGQLKNHNINLNAEKSNLQKCLREKHNEIARLIKKVNAHNAEIVHVRIVGKKSEPLNNTREGKGIFYYNRIGLVHKEQVINLTQIKGIGLWVEEKHMSDIYTFDQIKKLVPIDVESITMESDVTPNYRVNWVTQVHKLIKMQLYQAMN
jgi:predicted flap endonuclease-1-like 5' DNA nuclease